MSGGGFVLSPSWLQRKMLYKYNRQMPLLTSWFSNKGLITSISIGFISLNLVIKCLSFDIFQN